MRYFKYIFLGLAITAMFTSCKEDAVLDAPSSKIEGISDTWILSSVIQVDELDQISLESELDVSKVFIGNTPAEVVFESTNFTFEVTEGSSASFLPTSGTWRFENTVNAEWNDKYPEQLVLTDNNGVETTLPLLRTVRTVDATLEFQLDRWCNGAVASSYKYQFTRK